MTEVWRPVVGFEGFYAVSDQGRLKSVQRTRIGKSGKVVPIHEKFIGSESKQSGYVLARLHRGGVVYRTASVQSLVLESFVGPRPAGCDICHSDGTRSNNRLSNLRYDSPTENARDRDLHGRTVRGEKHYCARLNEQVVRDIRSETTLSARGWARKLGVTDTSVLKAKHGRTWKHVT